MWSTLADGLSPRTLNSLTQTFHRLCRTMEAESLSADPPRVESWKFRFHDLRHLSATEMVGQGMDLRTVARRLGHANLTVMKRCRIELVSEGAKWPMTHMSACLGLFALGRPGQLVASQPFITTGNISFLSAMPAGSLASPLATRVSTWVAWPMTVILRPS